MLSLQEKYKQEVIPLLQKQFGYTHRMAVPRMVKAVVNVGMGRMRDDKQHDEVRKFLRLITGQVPAARPAKQAIASFKTRKGLIVGYQVTLRGTRMYDFVSRLIHLALPRTRDFQGIKRTASDKKGNLTIGMKEHIVFPEMVGADYHFLFGLEATIVTTARNQEEGIALLSMLGFPIQKEGLGA